MIASFNKTGALFEKYNALIQGTAGSYISLRISV